MTDPRVAFEAWMRDVYFDGCDDAGPWDEERNCYVEFTSHMAWKGYQAGIKHEREECAKVCEARAIEPYAEVDQESRACAAAIRARSA